MFLEHPVAIAIHDYESRETPSERLEALVLAFEILLRVDACLLATFFLTSPECRDSKVADLLLTDSKRFTLGTWLELLQALVAVIPIEAASGIIEWVSMNEGGGNPLRELLTLRNRDAHEESRTQAGTKKEILARAEALFLRCMRRHPPLGRVIQSEDGHLTLDIGHRTMAGGPFLLSGREIEHPETVLVYRGCGKEVLEYGSLTGLSYESSVTYLEVLDHLKGKQTRVNVIAGRRARHSVTERMVKHTQSTLKRLIDLHRYRPEIGVDRSELDLKLHAFLESPQRLMIVEGGSGSGKTFWLCRVVERRLREGRAVLFETAEHLGYAPLPESLGELLRIKDFLTVSEQSARDSEDNWLLVVLDALETGGRENELLLALFRFVDKLELASGIKVLATIRAERWWLFCDEHEAALPLANLYEQGMPALSLYSLQELAQKLPSGTNSDAEAIVAARLETAKRMASLAWDSSLQPGLAVAILEAVSTSTIPDTFSAVRVYEELFRRIVLGVGEFQQSRPWRGNPKQPWRAIVVKGIAGLLMAHMTDRVSLEDAEVEPMHLIEPATGQRSMMYSGLLSDRILAEILEDFTSYILFIDPRFFEFVAALTLSYLKPTEVLTELYKKWRRYPPALAVAAFYLTRAVRASGVLSTLAMVEEIPHWQEPLLLELAVIDGETFLRLYEPFAGVRPELALALVEKLTERGAPRLATHAAGILIEKLAGEGSEAEDRARYLRARALYEVDDYLAAENELNRLGNRLSLSSFRAEIALARGDLERAKQEYQNLLQAPELSVEVKADALGGLGYICYRLGEFESAESLLREAVSLLEPEHSALLAETLGDLGQVLMVNRHLETARQCLERDLMISRRIGHLGGVCVAKSLLARLSFLQGRTEDAEQEFRSALRMARQIGNRWREAWILDGFSEVCRSLGRYDEAEMFACESNAISKELGGITISTAEKNREKKAEGL